MILVDTSAWIEFLRDTGSPACLEVDRLLGSDIAITDAVGMEVLAGARDEHDVARLRGLLGLASLRPSDWRDFDTAAQLHRQCRRAGETIRSLIDCLIASVAIREGMPLLHRDADFDALARHTLLKVHPA